ncbi:caspase family protein [Streptomyces sp. NBC_01476]|uniref:caspase, EACC1-associated type n=1 Tax=Streptomyces sp. NBC_01476 TaxID=2903881 RepID=UPI002E353928|nr:hypothetical protein [Streptomyces sp. NBC_01476]
MTHWAVRLPDRMASRAVLVGTATHVSPSDLTPMPQATGSVREVAAALTGPAGALHPSGVRCVFDPRSRDEVLDAVTAACTAPGTDLLLFSFSGHGLIGEGGRLCLALTRSVDRESEAARTGLPADDVLRLLGASTARHKVAVLDCCYSGLALDTAATRGVHLLTATDARHKARYEPGERVTGFTRELLRLLGEGVPDGGELLDLGTVHRQLAVMLPSTAVRADAPLDHRYPAPRQRAVDGSADLALARNPAFGRGTTRAGLRSRAHFADRVLQLSRPDDDAPFGRPDRALQAVRLFAAITADATASCGPTDPDTLDYARAHATAVALSGDPAGAVRLLETMLAAPPPPGAPPAPEAALAETRKARDHWARRTAAG